MKEYIDAKVTSSLVYSLPSGSAMSYQYINIWIHFYIPFKHTTIDKKELIALAFSFIYEPKGGNVCTGRRQRTDPTFSFGIVCGVVHWNDMIRAMIGEFPSEVRITWCCISKVTTITFKITTSCICRKQFLNNTIWALASTYTRVWLFFV